MRVRVSVVVPVYNPGRHIEPLIESLLAQTLRPPAIEVVFVDDGSTDETPARLDRLAAEREHVHVIHQPNSGWPGKPRNVGLEQARGDYVFFSDNDDWFGVEALERLLRVADEQSADIVIGRMVGHNRGVPRELFRRERLDATLADTQLEMSLTPHKLFRRQFLLDHDLRFPEGRRRLEDHVFVMRAYFAAARICVVTGYDYYHHIAREDESNAGFREIAPAGYYANVRETVDVVLANTSAGAVRDRLLRRFLTIEVLSRLSDPRLREAPEDYRRSLFDHARRLVVEAMPETVDGGMRARQRLQAQLLRAGDRVGLERLADELPDASGALRAARWMDRSLGLEWSMAVTAPLVRRAGASLTLLADPTGAIGVADDLAAARVDALAVDDEKGEVLLPTRSHVAVDAAGRLTASGTATVDVTALPPGTWRLRLRMRALGWIVDAGPLESTDAWRGLRAAYVGAGAGADAVLVRPAVLRSRAAVVDVAGAAHWLDDELVASVRAASAVVPVAARGAAALEVRVGAGVVEAPVRPVGDHALGVELPDDMTDGRVSVRAAPGGRWIDVGVVRHDGQLRVDRRRATLALASRLQRRVARLLPTRRP